MTKGHIVDFTSWWHHIQELGNWVPFLVTGDKQPRFSLQRLSETIIIGLLAGGSAYLSMKVDIAVLSDRVTTLAEQVKQMQHDFYKPRVGT